MSGTTWIAQCAAGMWRKSVHWSVQMASHLLDRFDLQAMIVAIAARFRFYRQCIGHQIAIKRASVIDAVLRSIPMTRTFAFAQREWFVEAKFLALSQSFARHVTRRPAMALLLALMLTSLPGMASAQDAGQPTKQENAPPPTTGNTTNESTVKVTANADRTTATQIIAGIQLTNSSGGLHGQVFLSNSTAPSNASDKDKSGGLCSGNIQGKPIEISSGTKLETYPIFALPGEMGLKYVLYYNTAAHPSHWTSNFGYSLDTDCEDQIDNTTGGCTHTTAYRPDGSTLKFSGGPDASAYQETFENGLSVTNAVATLSRDPTTGNYTLQDEDASTEVYSSAGGLLSIKDASGIGWTITASSSSMIVTHTDGQSITITGGPVTQSQQNGQNVIGQVVTVTDPSGQTYTFDYGDAYAPNAEINDVASITFPGTPATVISFKYNSYATPPYANQLVESDYNGVPYAYTTYVTASASPYYEWANSTSLADGSETVAIAYGASSAGNLAATITNPLGHVSVNAYDGTNGSGGAYNGQLSSVSNDAVTDCGATVATRSYDANGNLATTVDNNGNVHTYNYAANGQLQTETEAYGTPQARTTDYVWDPNLRLNRLQSVTVEGWSKTTYTYNAQNRLASIAVTNLSGNGMANQTLTTSYGYTLYANGMVHTMAVTHPSLNNSDTDTSTYDALGNLTSLANGLGQATNYSNYNGLGEPGHVVGPNGDVTDYTYDARGRVATKTTHPNGSAAAWTYGYDGFGLLASVSAPDGEVITWNRDPEMRVTSTTHNDKDGTSTETFGYDANNDVTSDVVSRGGVVSSSVDVQYDTLARPYQKQGNHDQVLTYGYDGNGNVLSMSDAAGHVTSYQYDALDRVTQKTESGGASPAIPSGVPTLSAPTNSTNGSYALSWSAVSGASAYELQEQVNGGSWATVQNNSGLGWNASGKANGTYAYRVHACDVTGCGPWSNLATVSVLYPPGTPSLSVPASNNTGSYTVSWSAAATATTYNLHEQVNGGSWATVQSNGTTVWGATSKANGTYGYQVQACNTSGCSAWSSAGSVTVLLPPASAPSLSAPANNATGSYTVSWTSVATATSYSLKEQINGGSWTIVQSSNATNWGAAGQSDGTYAYQVQACNGGGCGAWSSTSTTTVLFPPGSPPSVSSPSTNSTGSYTVSWSTIVNATSYTLQERVNGGAWTTVQSSSATTWSATSKANGTYSYQAQSCNSGGCSAWSSVSTTTVLHPPGSAPTLSVPGSSTTGSYTVSWSAISTATSYNLQKQVNGGSWTTVQSSGSTSWSVSGQGDGSYGYQVQACNSGGCGPWSSVASASVLLPPGSAPSLSVPGSNGNGSYTVSWSGVATATSYNLQEQVNGGGWTTVQSGASTSWSTSGRGDATYGYHVQACNSSGCGPWSSVASTNVLLPPGSAPALNVPGANGNGSYTVSWSGVSTATSYTLQEQVNGGGWTTVQANGNTSWNASGKGTATYGYRVQACNASGCGAWSGTGSITVTIPVPIAINGQSYTTSSSPGSTGGASATIGFEITGGNTWEVFTSNQHVANTLVVSGAVPAGATTVQYTWTEVGLASGANLGGGTVTNGASTPTALSGNPSSNYSVAMGRNSGNIEGLTYQVTVTFYNAAGANVSSSTCTMTATVAGAL